MQTPDQILTQAKTICEAAFADPTRNAPGQPGKDSVAVGSVLLLKKDLQSPEKNWYRSLWTLSYLDWQPENDVRSLLCVHQGEMAVGTYVAAPGASSTGTAYRADWEGRLVSWPDGRLLARRSFTGNPPPQMKFGQGDAYGGVSEAEVLEWLAGGLGVSPLLRHREGVWGVAIAPDGRKLAAAWGNGVTIWDLTSRRELLILPPHGLKVAFSPDGKMLATSAPRDGIKVWDVATGKELHALRTPNAPLYSNVCFSPDGKLVAAGGPNAVFLWDLATDSLIHEFAKHTSGVESVAFSPDGMRLASGDMDNTVRLWDVASKQPIRTLVGHANRVASLGFSPDGTKLISGSRDGAVIIWNARTGAKLSSFQGVKENLQAIALSPDGNLLAVAGGDFDPSQGLKYVVIVWDLAGGKPIRSLSTHGREVYSVTFSPDSRMLASGSADTTVMLWDVTAWRSKH